MRRLALIALVLSQAGTVASLAAPPPSRPSSSEPDFGLSAPLAAVDRFGDGAATRLRRSALPNLPGPNQPIDFDHAPFVRSVQLANGTTRTCYDLDLRPARPMRAYFFYDSQGGYVLTQFPIIDALPGDSDYNDVWEAWKVTVPDTYRRDNSVRDLATLQKLLADPASGYTAATSGILVNAPVVPEGSTAAHRADGKDGAAVLRYAWYRGTRAPYLYFEGSIRPVDGAVPIDAWTAEKDGGFRGGVIPGAPGYTPLHGVGDAPGKASSRNPLNCPVVGRNDETER